MLSIEPGPPPFSPHLCIITQNEEEISIHSTCPWNICKYSSRRFVQFDDQESCTKRLNDRAYVLYEFSCDGFHERMKQITVTVGRSVSPSTSKRQQASNSGRSISKWQKIVFRVLLSITIDACMFHTVPWSRKNHMYSQRVQNKTVTSYIDYHFTTVYGTS